MAKKILGVLFCMLMVSSVFVGVNNASTPRTGTVRVNIPVGSYTIEKTVQGDLISVDGFGRLLTPGKPNLPSRTFSIAIPPGARVVDISTSTTDIPLLGEYTIPPSALPRVIGKEDPVIYAQELQDYAENHASVYTSNSPYPSSVAEIVGTGGYRKYNLVDVRVSPLSYYPLADKVIFHSVISLSITYTIPEDASSQVIDDNLPQTEETARDIIVNYDEARNWYPASPLTRGLYDYVIITTDALASSVGPLADWEAAKGRTVNVVTTSWITDNYDGYDLAAKIRAFLVEKYPSGEWGIQDVCLVGSYTDVPMRLTAQNLGYGATRTDYYYAELSLPDSQSWDADGDHRYGENSGDPIDFQAEVNVGRIPWSDASTVYGICEKSAAYEQNTADSFKKNILLLGAYFWSDTDNAVLMEKKVDQDWMTDWTMTRMYEDAQSMYPCDYDLTYDNVESVWSQGTYAFVDWAGHGSPDAAYELYPEQPFVDETSVATLNDGYPAIVFADSCSNSDSDYLNIGQALLKQGAVGFVGSNKVALGCPGWNNPMSGSSQSLDYFFTTCCTSGDYTQGQALQYALRQMYTNDLWSYIRYEMFEWGSLWGNPDLTMGLVVVSNPPETPSLTGPTHGGINITYTYSSSTTDPDGDSVYYLFDWGDGSSTGWLGPNASGSTVSAQHSWANVGNYTVKVKAKDTNGAASGWSDPLNMAISADRPPETPTITGPASGAPRTSYPYVIQATDPDGDNVSYFIDWGDGTTTDWIGPYPSGQEITQNHSWLIRGAYNVTVKARDGFGLESDWGSLHVVMPYYPPLWAFLQRLFDRFPNAFPILRYLFGL